MKHQKNAHPEKTNSLDQNKSRQRAKFKCPECDQMYSNITILRNHLMEAHDYEDDQSKADSYSERPGQITKKLPYDFVAYIVPVAYWTLSPLV